MALDPQDFLAQADLLMATGVEAGYRTAINRAYYACHLLARDRLFNLDAARWEAGSRRPSHRAVITALQQHPSFSTVTRELESLKTMREVADYVRSDEHPELLDLFARYSVSRWQDLASRALPRARETFATLRLSLREAP